MAIPSLAKIRKPLLEFLGDRKYHSLAECIDYLGERFSLTDEEKTERYEGKSKRKKFDKLVTYAVSEFRIAGIVGDETKPGDASFHITETGLELLGKKHEEITNKILKQFGEYAFSNKIYAKNKQELFEENSPEEIVDESEDRYRWQLESELLTQIKNRFPSQGFERLCLKLFEKMGYGESQHTGQSGDRGVDGIISEDELGLKKIYVQTKKYEGTVPYDDVINFYGKCVRDKIPGIFVTTSDFSKNTKEEMEKDSLIKLINGKTLASLLYDHNIGIKVEYTVEFKQINDEELKDFT